MAFRPEYERRKAQRLRRNRHVVPVAGHRITRSGLAVSRHSSTRLKMRSAAIPKLRAAGCMRAGVSSQIPTILRRGMFGDHPKQIPHVHVIEVDPGNSQFHKD